MIALAAVAVMRTWMPFWPAVIAMGLVQLSSSDALKPEFWTLEEK